MATAAIEGEDPQDLTRKFDELIEAVERGNDAAERRANRQQTGGGAVTDVRER